MQAFEFALALVALILVFKLVRLAIVHNKRPPRRDDPVNTELLERLNQVEERVRVLEGPLLRLSWTGLSPEEPEERRRARCPSRRYGPSAGQWELVWTPS